MTAKVLNETCMEGPPGSPESWTCGKCGAKVRNSQPVCPNCGARR